MQVCRRWCSVQGRAALVVSLVCGAWPAARAAETPAAAGDAFAQNARLGRGVNIIGYDPIWKDRARGRFQAEHFALIAGAGFNHVRINLHPYRDARLDAQHTLSDAYLATLDWALDQALAAKLMVILDFHEFTAMARDPRGKKERYLAIWAQIAERCRTRPPEVLFELLNEPNGELTPELWNEFLREALALVRRTNPNRTVIIGPGQWNGIGQLGKLALPADDRNIIVTVHYYSPMEFTHQGAPWTGQKDKLGVPWDGTPEQLDAIARDFDKAAAWAAKEKRPIYLGEFGAYDKAEMAARVRYIGAVARAAEKRGWSWGYWQFDSDFILYDIPGKRWIEPIRDALVPPRQ